MTGLLLQGAAPDSAASLARDVWSTRPFQGGLYLESFLRGALELETTHWLATGGTLLVTSGLVFGFISSQSFGCIGKTRPGSAMSSGR